MNVPEIDSRTIDIIEFGANIDFQIEVSNLDKFSFQKFEGPQAVAILDVIVEHLCMSTFFGPFPPEMTH